MRHSITLAAAVLLVLALPPARAHAQCPTGCSSSSSCGATGRAGCVAECDGWGNCKCEDDKCPPQLRPVALAPAGAPAVFAALAGETAHGAALLVDCRGNVLDVRLSGRDGRALFGEVRAIAFRRPAPPDRRLAARE